MSRSRLIALTVMLVPIAGAAAGKRVDPGIKLVAVKGGCFIMGDVAGDGEFETKPAHEVCVDDFAIGKYEVTQEQFERVVGANPSQTQRCPTCPVDSITWELAQTFLERLNALTGRSYRLPTEAEWEYACRGRGKQQKYCGGDDPDRFGWSDTVNGGMHPVGLKKPNALGLHDMSGNAAELVSDWYSEIFYWVSPRSNPVGPTSSWSAMDDEPGRVVRGLGRATLRSSCPPGAVSPGQGLRVALSRRPPSAPSAAPIPGKPGPEHGVELLGAGGGAPGAAFAAWEKAQAEAWKRLFATMDKREVVKKLLAQAAADSRRPASQRLELTDDQLDAMYESFRQDPPRVGTRIEAGLLKGDLAILTSPKVPSDPGFEQTLVYLIRKDGAWTVHHRLLRYGFATQGDLRVEGSGK